MAHARMARILREIPAVAPALRDEREEPWSEGFSVIEGDAASDRTGPVAVIVGRLDVEKKVDGDTQA